MYLQGFVCWDSGSDVRGSWWIGLSHMKHNHLWVSSLLPFTLKTDNFSKHLAYWESLSRDLTEARDLYVCLCSVVQATLVTPWTVACQGPLSMGSPRQEHWSVLPFPSPRDLPNPGIEPAFLVSPALAGRFFTTVPPGKWPKTATSNSSSHSVHLPHLPYKGAVSFS